MINSRLAQMKHAKIELEHGLKHNFPNLEERAKRMIDLLNDVNYHNPLPPTNKQYMAETFYAQHYARLLLKDLPLYLLRNGQVEDIYNMVKDPYALSTSITWALRCHPDSDIYPELQQLLRVSLELGGVISSTFPADMNDLNNPRHARENFNFPSMDMVKRLLVNQLQNEWSVEPSADNSHRYSQFLSFLIAYVGDEDPEWAVRFMLEHDERVQEIFEVNLFDVQMPEIRGIAGCIHSAHTSKILVELNRQRPELFEALMDTRFMGMCLEQSVWEHPGFKLADIPLHESTDKKRLIEMFITCAGRNALSEERRQDLNAVWSKLGLPGSLEKEALKSKRAYSILENSKSYNEFLRREELSPATILAHKQEHSMIGDQFTILDALINKPGKRIADSPETLSRHVAFVIVSSDPSDEYLNNAPIAVATIGAALLMLKEQSESKKSDGLVKLVKTAFADKKHHPELCKISKFLLDIARKEIPGLKEASLRKINWQDRSIKAHMVTEDLGL